MKKSKKIYKTIICTRISSQKNNNNMRSNSLPINKRESNLLGYDVFYICARGCYLFARDQGRNEHGFQTFVSINEKEIEDRGSRETGISLFLSLPKPETAIIYMALLE